MAVHYRGTPTRQGRSRATALYPRRLRLTFLSSPVGRTKWKHKPKLTNSWPQRTTSFTVTPNYGYSASVTGCGGTLSGNTYTTGPITSDCAVSATFTALPTYTVTSSAGANGNVNPTSATVDSGYNFTLTITPSSGYHLSSLTDNGTNVTTAAYWNGGSYTYTITVWLNHTMQATFASGSPPPAQGPALSIFAVIFLAVVGLGVILWVRRKVNA